MNPVASAFRRKTGVALAIPAVASEMPVQTARSPSRAGLFQLDQDAMRAGRMDKCHEGAMRTRAWRLVDQPHAAGFQLSQHEGDVVDTKRDVVQAGATPV